MRLYHRDARKNFYYHLGANATVTVGPSIAILVDVAANVVLMHGHPAFVQAKFDEIVRARRAKGDAVDHIVLFDNARWTPAVLNAIVNQPGAVADWWRLMVKHGALAAPNGRTVH